MEEIQAYLSDPTVACKVIRARIQDMAELGAIRDPHVQALVNKLTSAIKQTEKGNFAAAQNQLMAVVAEVQELEASGHLDPADAERILGWARPIIEALAG